MSSAGKNDGFTKDCQQLLSNFRKNDGCDFSNFCEEWKAMNFHYIFSGFRNDMEMIYNINEYFVTLKEMFINSQSLLDKVGILFLMYAIYYKQPPKEYCKIRVTIDEWKIFKELYEKFHEHEEFNKIKLIFWTMIRSGAFVFVESERKYTFEYFMRKEFEDEVVKESPNLYRTLYQRDEAKIMNPESGLLPALKFLEDAYNEMKDLLDHSNRTEKSLPNTSIVSELYNGFKNISNIFEMDPTEQESDHCPGDSTDSDDLREQVETSIKERRAAIKRRALTNNNKNTSKNVVDLNSESDDNDNAPIERSKNPDTSVSTGKTSLTISFSKPKYVTRDTNKSTCSKLLDSIEKVAADELQEQTKVNVVPVEVVQQSLNIIL